MARDLGRGWRVPLLVLGMLSLAAGVDAGLLRLGWLLPAPGAATVLDHGPLMICGFFGTVISLERAVALGARWAYLAPLCAGLGGLALLAGFSPLPASALMLAGAGLLSAATWQLYRRQPALHTLVLLVAAAAWAAGSALEIAGWGVPAVVPLWTAFLVLTIAGERLELSRFLPPSAVARRAFAIIVALLLAGAVVSVADLAAGGSLFAAALLALAAWLLRQDIARRTIRERGLTRFVAACLLPGYAWLGIGALVLLADGGLLPGSPGYDAGLHALLIGFVLSMVFGHALIIFPAVLGLRLAYGAIFYAPLLLLHLSVLLRVGGDLAGAGTLRGMGGLLTAAALLLFILTLLAAGLRARRN
ncbi:MAG: hypothetical protein KJ054_03790 [Gammaproteobacteria bacterium]|nr:hypothetical protein [Gammaproteobacteria bacterium]